MTGREKMDRDKLIRCENRLLSLPKYVTEWYNHLRASGKTATTCDVMTGKIASFLYYINDGDIFEAEQTKAEQITASIVEQYLVSVKQTVKNGVVQKTSNSHQQAVWSTLNSFLSFMAKRGYIPENYITEQEIKCTNKRDTVERPYLTGEDFKKIIDVVSYRKEWDKTRMRDVAILMLFMNTGIRVSALCSIDIDDVDVENGYLKVMEKGEKERKCKLNDKTLRALEDWLDIREYMLKSPWEEALFVSTHGFRINPKSVRDTIKKRCKEAGYELTPHMLRGGYITILQDATGDINFVCDAVGHSNISTTKRYIRNNGKQSEIAADIMAKAMNI